MTMKLSQGEKLILLMLCEIQDHLKMKKSETNTELVKEAIFSGNLWGLERGMHGLFHDYETPEHVVTEAGNILFMWRRLEDSFKGLSKKDKGWLAKNAFLGDHVTFHGFDGNDKTEVQYNIAARFMVEQLGEFGLFKGREFSAHMPTLQAYRRMLAVFDPILHQVSNRDFSAAQIAEVLNAYKASGPSVKQSEQ